jgi:DNA-binding beta-propeller fold protein YncE
MMTMVRMWQLSGMVLFLAASAACAQPFRGETIAIATDTKGIGFDDLRYSPSLHRVLVPAGRTGTIVLIDPSNHERSAIAGLSTEKVYGGGHGEGTTSVDEGEGALYAIDRDSKEVVILDPVSRHVTARAALGGSPDYVRYVAATRELWVTEPDSERIEVFSISTKRDGLTSLASIALPGGPESLVIDTPGGHAFTHLWSGTSVVVDLRSRKITAKWPNRCDGSRGIAYDESSHFLFAGCAEGKAVVMDAARGGAVLATASAGSGVDIIDYDPARRHLYLPGSKSATMTIFSVGTNGALTPLGTVPTMHGAHCVTTDGKDAYVCDPDGGRILVIHDSFPPVKP